MPKISAYILTYNEAEKIEAAVSSVLWADEVVVIDSFSIDRTGEIATSLGARVVELPFNGFGELRNRAVEACKFDWIFSLDSDERCTEAVRDEILGLLAGTPPHDVYLVPRRSYMMGRWIKGSGWYPNFRQPQLFRKDSMRYTLEPVHEGYEVLNGKSVGTLQNAIWQFPFRNLEEVIKKMNRYSRWRARSDTVCGHSSSITFSSWASSTAGPDSSLRSETSKARFTATPNAMKRRKAGSRRRVSRSGASRLLEPARTLDH
jgi:glycosyltransferase involved in cell wall biosynthesis